MAKKIKLVTLDFDYAAIGQDTRKLIIEQKKLPYAYNRSSSTDLLCNRDDKATIINNTIDKEREHALAFKSSLDALMLALN